MRRTQNIDNPEDAPNESIWTALAETKHWYLGIFTLLATSGEVVVVTGEIGQHQGIIETWRAVIGPSADVMAASAGAAYALTEIGRTTVVIAKSIEKWLEDRRRRRLEAAREIALKEGHEEGRQEGRAEERQLWRDWLARREEAQNRGKTFTEPPPNGKL
jgi:hypothetical protein